MEAFLRDVRLAVRMLRRRARFTLLAGFVLAVAIGANTAIFSAVQGVLLRPPAFEDPSRLVMLWERQAGGADERNVVGPYNFTHWRERARSFTDMAAYVRWRQNITGGGAPERLDVGVATGNLFSVLGVGALHGRPLSLEDSRPGAPEVTVLSEGFWRRRFAGDPGVIGRPIMLGGEPTVVVGVMPRSFQVPPDVSLWLPYTLDPSLRDPASPASGGRWMTVVARLRPGVTLAQAREEMSRLAADLARENPRFDSGWTAVVHPLHADLVRNVRPALLLLMGAVVLLLLIACANVATLLLSRGASRQREVAIRTALGAGRSRIVRQLLTESVLLGLLGGAGGVLLALWGLKGLLALLPAEVRLATDVRLTAACWRSRPACRC